MSFFSKEKNWKELFPFDTLRPNQEKMCSDLAEGIKKYPVNIVIAPNGFGKTGTILSVVTSFPSEGVIITTRTHRQIDHFVETIQLIAKKTKENIPYVEWGSRSFLCINPDVLSTSQNMFDIGCQQHIVVNETHPRYCNYEPHEKDDKIKAPTTVSGKEPENADIKNLYKWGKENQICPYYTARCLGHIYPVLFASYNYIFDPFLRKILDIDINGKVIVCDEAHNVINVMEEAMKREINDDTIEKIISNINVPSRIKSFLRKVKKFIISVSNSFNMKGSQIGISYGEIGMLMRTSGCTLSNLTSFEQACYEMRETSSMIAILNQLNDIISFFHIYYEVDEKSFIGYIRKDPKKKGKILGIQSLNIAPIIHDIIDENAKIIFMSGTLSSEMFKTRLKLKEDRDVKTHYYESSERKILLYIISNGVNGNLLSTVYTKRNDYEMITDYGNTINAILPSIQGGSIIFFPSYTLKQDMMDYWNDKGIIKWNSSEDEFYFNLPNGKLLRIYDDKGDDKGITIKNFKERAKDQPCVLCATFRSRASEGEDYTGNIIKGIFIVGIPLANITDASVNLKIKYYDTLEKSLGQKWFYTDAMDAVNQACGRSIRNISVDKCAIFLMDSRYKSGTFFNMLSQWIRNGKQPNPDFHIPKYINPVLVKFFK